LNSRTGKFEFTGVEIRLTKNLDEIGGNIVHMVRSEMCIKFGLETRRE
jgi:hypothetical protein